MSANEPAFPRDHRYDGHNGMTMRQAYKIAALQGMYSNSGLVDNFSAHESMVKEASRVADAMLAEDAAHASRKGGEK